MYVLLLIHALDHLIIVAVVARYILIISASGLLVHAIMQVSSLIAASVLEGFLRVRV